MAKKTKGSKNRGKLRLKIARLHAKIADCRMDATHKASRTLIKNQVVCVETLTVKNMMKNPKLAKHIADANGGKFVRQVKYKSEWADRTPSRQRHKRSKEYQNHRADGVSLWSDWNGGKIGCTAGVV